MKQRKGHGTEWPKVHDILEMWQGSQNLCATQKESGAQNKQMTAVGYISDTEEIVNTSWTNFQHDGAAAFKWLERSPQPPALSAKDLLGAPTQLVNEGWIQTNDQHPAESDENSAPESISDTENWLNWNGDLDNWNVNEDDWEAENASDSAQDTVIEDPETPAQWDVSASPNVPGLLWPSRHSKKKAKRLVMMVSAMETRRNMGN